MASNVSDLLIPEYMKVLKEKDPDAFVSFRYLLHGKALKEEVACGVINCNYGRKTGKGELKVIDKQTAENSFYWIFCYCCDRAYHLSCAGYDFNTFSNLELISPWRCVNCKTNPCNATAVDFYNSSHWKQSIKERSSKFLKSADVEFDLNESIDVDPNQVKRLEREKNELVQQNKTQGHEINELKRMLQIMQSQLQGLMPKSEEQGGPSKSLSKIAERSSVSFGSVLNKPSSTLIDNSLDVTNVSAVNDTLSHQYLQRKSDMHLSAATAPLGESTTPLSTRVSSSDTVTPLLQGGQSFMNTIDVNELSVTDKLKYHKLQAQIASSEAQDRIHKQMNLELIRKNLGRMNKFDGDMRKWIKFKQDIKRFREVGQYNDDVLKLHVIQSLEGLALSRVQDIIDSAPLATTLKLLEESFGDPARIIDKCASDILALKLSKELYRDDVLVISTKIQAYFTACEYANVSYANSNHLATHIFDQLSITFKQMYRHQARLSHPDVKLIDLKVLFTFLEELSKDLEDKRSDEKKSRSVMVASVNPGTVVSTNGSSKSNDDFMYEIKDKNQASYIGYDLNLLNSFVKKCECCGKNGHYTVQCRKFKEMNSREKNSLVNEKRLCRNCLVTSSHKANECQLKSGCGYKFQNERCSRKHHISLHRAWWNEHGKLETGQRNSGNNKYGRKGHSNANLARATNIYNNAQQPTQAATTQAAATQASTSNGATSSTNSNVISRAPTLNQMPTGQLMNVNEHQVESNNTGSCNKYYVSPYQSRQIQSVTSFDIQRTVKVFKNKFLGKDGFVVGYSIGDSAAEVTMIREDLRQALKIEGEKCVLRLQWTDKSVKTIDAVRIDLEVQGILRSSKKILLKNCYAVPDLNLPARSLDMERLKKKFPYLRKVKFDSYEDVTPYLLIGSPHAAAIESAGKLFEDGEGKPVGLLAKLGWCVYGGCPESHLESPSSVQMIQNGEVKQPIKNETVTNEELHDLLTFFSSIESLGISNKSKHYTEDESKALEIVNEEMRVLDDGSIELPLIWNRNEKIIPRIPNNFKMVYMRQVAHEKKLAKNPDHLKAFNDNFKELIDEGYVRAADNVDLNTNWKNISYLPMSLVINANKMPVKYRNVFDASAKYQNVSLNMNLLKGPDLLVDLLHPLLNMRANRIAFTADIKSMFMRIKINLRDQQVQRVIWRERPEDEMRVFIVSSMLFGPTCSPFSSQFVKNHVADQFKGDFPEAAKIIKDLMYMDDLLTSVDKVNEAIEVAQQCIEIFKSINWHLVAFQSNSLEFLKALPQANVKQDMIPLLESENDHYTTKVLGCVWDTKRDCFVYQFDKNLFVKIVKECAHRPTKRDQCSTLARIFDVMGLISHFTVRGKILLQRSWKNGRGWDEEVSEAEHQAWLDWINEIENIVKVKINRKYNELKSLSGCDSVELHVFCDAGAEAFAAVSYLVTIINGERYSNIVLAKAKVTPLRFKSKTQITEMPRLELCACLIASRLADTITKYYPEIPLRRWLWSDSEVVLRWIINPNHQLLRYAISPIEEILEKTNRNEWRYVSTKLNSADVATKIKPFDFANSESVWFKGPQFLKFKECHWPQMPELLDEIPVESLNVCNVNQVDYVSSVKLPPINCPIAADYLIDSLRPSIKDSWPKLVRATARALKLFDAFIYLIKSKQWRNDKFWKYIKENNGNFETLNATELERAEHFLIRKAQREGFEKEYSLLKAGRPIYNAEFQQLNVFMDSEGLIRINSRVNLNKYEYYPQQFAFLVPRKHAITRALLLHTHCEFKHICIESQIASLRSRFWIPQIRAALKSIQAHCNFCSWKRAMPHAPIMAPLPSFRTNPTQLPFEVTGLDCLGPLVVKVYNRPKKIWILIFVCTLTRFIHLHILESLESKLVLEAIVSFWAAHGPVRTFVSDRGTNFIGAARVLREDKDQTLRFLKSQHKEHAEQLAQRFNVDWQMLPAYSPWMGAFYERLIKEVKRAIATVLDQKKLTKTELSIAIQDAAHRINCRPLTHNSVSAEDVPILTPHHLAKNRSGWPYLPGLPSTNNSDIREDKSTYRRGRLIADELMKRFYLYYLPILTKRTKWFRDEAPLQVNDLVLMIEPNETRKEWSRGKVIRLYKGSDKKHRVADVLLSDGTVKKARSVQRLAKLNLHRIEDAN